MLVPTSVEIFVITGTEVIAQGTTVTGIKLVAPVAVGLPYILTSKFLVVDQLLALNVAVVLFTFVALIMIEVPDTEAVAEPPDEQLL
jgi:hypothetical protein